MASSGRWAEPARHAVTQKGDDRFARSVPCDRAAEVCPDGGLVDGSIDSASLLTMACARGVAAHLDAE